MLLLYISIIIITTTFYAIRKRIKRIDLEKLHHELEKANAPKFLYLRGFNVDGDNRGSGLLDIMKLRPKELELTDLLIDFEHHLVAVGNPFDEDVSKVGFDRIKFSNVTWQQEVLQLMEDSHLIIYRPDNSLGILWEISKILELGYREKLIIWTDMGFDYSKDIQKARYNVFRRKLWEQFSEQIPPYEKNKKFMASNSKNCWESFSSLKQTPIYTRLSNSKSMTNTDIFSTSADPEHL